MRTSASGNALLLSVIVTLVILGIAGSYFSLSMVNERGTSGSVQGLQAFYIAESAAALCLTDLNQGGPGMANGKMGKGDFTITMTDYKSDGKDNDGDGKLDGADSDELNFMEMNVEGRFAGQARRLEIILTRTAGGVYWNALFAGNSSGDPTYSLNMGGKGAQADAVTGDVYSGGNFGKTGNATVDPYKVGGSIQDPNEHQVMASGDATDTSTQNPQPNYKQGQQSLPDIAGMQYEKNHDVNIADALATRGTSGLDDAGGSAVQITDPDDPAHIFRMNPSDRTTLTSSTVKNDYFLEDPTAPVRVDPSQNGADAYHINLSNTGGNQVIYYIDGNLHLNNRKTYSFKFYHPQANGIQVTFVVKGNIYFGDNLFYTNKNKDSVAFIAMKDSKVPDSGNVYFGDPIYGTTKRFEGYMYAENNFYDNNLGTPSSMTTTIFGNMTAGNQVQIKRDKPDGTHVKLQVDFDPKAKEGKYAPPGLPATGNTSGGAWFIASWKQAP